MIHGVLARSSDTALKQPQFADQDRHVRNRNRASHEIRQAFEVQRAFRKLASRVCHTGEFESLRSPLAGIVVANDLAAPIFPRKRGEFLRDRSRIKRRATAADHVGDNATILAMSDADAESIMTAGTRVNECPVNDSLARRQLKRAAIVDRRVNHGVIEKLRQIAPKKAIPFRNSGFGVFVTGTLNVVAVQSRVEYFGFAL
jgi:hypothetical protein